MPSIHACEQVEPLTLAGIRHEVRVGMEVLDGVGTLWEDGRALSACGQECRSPVLRTIARVPAMIGQHDERGQVVVGRPEGVADPRAHARKSGALEPGRLEIHSADPQKARVIFKLHDSERAKLAGQRYSRDSQVDGVALYFAGKADLNGVVFDNVLEGCLMVSPQQRAKWRNVFYGEHNLAEPEKLYWDLK